ncbi:hypothetical protein [Pantoea septica]|uniref:DUF551 domain-containing protein n=1 Tax=Pantoea septica TaxID=472695 RepID=A0ABX3UNC4_9GAMM|nr:hypothetical protein [Pantoea septica]ORM96277.1 hypothetical protein HA46_17265 [Pantoea septica]
MEWISLEERTPEDGERCVVFTSEGEYKLGSYDEDEGNFYDFDFFDPIDGVKAWQTVFECTI